MEKILLIIISLALARTADAQIKETAQLATLTPTFLVVKSDIESYQKLHYSVSTTLYMGSYMITESYWKSAVMALLISASKEVVYDGLLGKGEPLWEDMKWNTLGTAQGAVFTLSLKF